MCPFHSPPTQIQGCQEKPVNYSKLTHSLQEALFTESPPSNYYIGGSTCMTSMYRVKLTHNFGYRVFVPGANMSNEKNCKLSL